MAQILTTAPERRFISLKEITLGPGELREFVIAGRYLRIKESTGVVKVQTDQGEFFDLEVGLAFGDETHPNFNSIFFKNPSTAVGISVSFYVSNVPITDSRLNTMISRTTIVGAQAALTYFIGHGSPSTNLASGASSAAMVGLDNSQGAWVNRKQLILRNLSSSAGALWIIDWTGLSVVDVLSPGDPPWTVESSGTFYLKAVGGAVDYIHGETYYMP